ncbi:MAG: DNA-deoxyinosine glycosylase [Oscillospiraceae bacterium]|nr:DNA-deoxyinosine glycosylase [Oscillospiraceae bacterium]
MKEEIVHPFGPLYSPDSRVLILGSFPSVKSREINFYYGHPQNRFWRVIPEVFGREKPTTIEEKKELILSCGLALWDTIGRCEITGSSDASIRNARPNDISIILRESKIRKIFCNGKTSFSLYSKLLEPITGMEAVCLPSTSPANAAWKTEDLIRAWSVIREYT